MSLSGSTAGFSEQFTYLFDKFHKTPAEVGYDLVLAIFTGIVAGLIVDIVIRRRDSLRKSEEIGLVYCRLTDIILDILQFDPSVVKKYTYSTKTLNYSGGHKIYTPLFPKDENAKELSTDSELRDQIINYRNKGKFLRSLVVRPDSYRRLKNGSKEYFRLSIRSERKIS